MSFRILLQSSREKPRNIQETGEPTILIDIADIYIQCTFTLPNFITVFQGQLSNWQQRAKNLEDANRLLTNEREELRQKCRENEMLFRKLHNDIVDLKVGIVGYSTRGNITPDHLPCFRETFASWFECVHCCRTSPAAARCRRTFSFSTIRSWSYNRCELPLLPLSPPITYCRRSISFQGKNSVQHEFQRVFTPHDNQAGVFGELGELIQVRGMGASVDCLL